MGKTCRWQEDEDEVKTKKQVREERKNRQQKRFEKFAYADYDIITDTFADPEDTSRFKNRR